MLDVHYGALLRGIRKRNKITLVELSLRSGVNRELIRRYETGKATPPTEALLSIMRGLGIDQLSVTGQQIVKSVMREGVNPELSAMIVKGPVAHGSKLDRLVKEYFDLSGLERSEAEEFLVTRRFAGILNED
jgi:transcriptional regulator with XRE-family HTH domain